MSDLSQPCPVHASYPGEPCPEPCNARPTEDLAFAENLLLAWSRDLLAAALDYAASRIATVHPTAARELTRLAAADGVIV